MRRRPVRAGSGSGSRARGSASRRGVSGCVMPVAEARRPARGSRSTSSSLSPVIVAMCAYSSQFQLIWLRRTFGKRKNGAARAAADAVGDQVDASPAAGSSTSRARQAYISASATLGSIDLSIAASRVPMLSTHPGCGTGDPARPAMRRARSRAASRTGAARATRARSSLRHGPVVAGERRDRVRRQQQRVVVDAPDGAVAGPVEAACPAPTARRSRARSSRRSASSRRRVKGGRGRPGGPSAAVLGAVEAGAGTGGGTRPAGGQRRRRPARSAA